MLYQGLLYRALNPIYAREPLSGEGARRFGGRFNPRGMPALYTSQSIMTAIREANQVGTLQPTTLVAYEADISPIFDATDPAALEREGLAPETLADPAWRLAMAADGKAPMQLLAAKLKREGYAGLQVRSFTKQATANDLNLVLWVWGDELPARLRVVDDQGRLK
jgi:RES domain-containing protein